MDAMTAITTEVDAETLASIDNAASLSGLSRADFVANAISRQVEQTAEYLAFIQKGIDDLDAGGTLTHEQFAERLKGRFPVRKTA